MRKSSALLALLLGMVGVAGVAGPAVASDVRQVPARHCVGDLDTGRVTCAGSPDDARQLSDIGASALTIAIFYDSTGFSGATFTWTQSSACTPSYDAEWQWDDLADIGWNNRVTSVRTYNQCDVKLFDGKNFGGASSVWIDSASNLGTIGDGWNNRASSVKFS